MAPFQLPVDLADAFEACRDGPATVVVRHDFQAAFEARGLASAAVSPPDGAELRGGRGGAWAAIAEGFGAFVVRPGQRGGWPGRIVRTRYFLGHRFLDELVLTERLRRLGAPVPEALAAVQRDKSIGYETWLITRRTAARPLPDIIANLTVAEAAGPMEEAGRLVGSFHAAGGEHADLNAYNLLLGEGDGRPAGVVIDLDRGRLHPGGARPAARRTELARLRRSLSKLGLAAGLGAWPRFERGYASPCTGPSDRVGGSATP